MPYLILLQKNTLIQKINSDLLGGIIILFLSIILVIIYQKIKSNRKSFEEKIIQTIKQNRIIDLTFFDNLSEEEMKVNIRREINRINEKHRRKFIDLQKMEDLIKELTTENLRKLYQWFFYKGSC
ncbi:hypothetical protein ACFS5J_11205 [Flavobacterium chuncheonense]|uniref:Uncharacterized protein n=1 Tax=Flavobacterium chuncheonense TaxID=2026653 RepID=A0ABW5YNI8_9FLAO